ncbi:MAG TPA: FMN-binding protein [Thiobacillaceae bacterium]|nr:FMN-binding protein [Thiobacillaceae bacterium]HNU64984.1 FMN-binding protein [Thiobacillaceae bacterium]
MSAPPRLDAPLPQPASSTAMLRTLGLVAGLCGILIVSAYQGTQEAVTANRKIALERAVFQIIPGAQRVDEYFATRGGLVPAQGNVPDGAVKFYAAYDTAGKLRGIAAEGAARGYADTVRVLYAYDPVRRVINGMGVIYMRETPGIGDKIATDSAFLRNFQALDASLGADPQTLANTIRVVKQGSKQHPWEIDAISGATITSKAVGRGINDSAGRLLPLLVPHLASLKEAR